MLNQHPAGIVGQRRMPGNFELMKWDLERWPRAYQDFFASADA